jgi:hypothetical protein
MGASALYLVPSYVRQYADAVALARPGMIALGVGAVVVALPAIGALLIVGGLILLILPLAVIVVGAALV